VIAATALVLAFAASMVASTTPADAAYWHSCSRPRSLPIGSLQAHDVHCGKARRIINGFYRKAQSEGPDVFVAGFHCLAVVGGTSCRRGSQRVRLTGSTERLPVSRDPMLATSSAVSCPAAATLERPVNTRGAIPAAKAALGSAGRVLEVKRGPGSTYAAAAKQACGVEVLRDSIYVVVHPVGRTCSACNLHAYVVKLREEAWKVWIAF
jgi:hypothetical protein